MRAPLALAVILTLAGCAAQPSGPGRQEGPARTVPTPSPTPRAERYVAIGASDTVGVGATDPRTGSWPARIARRLPPGSTYTNYGVSGSLAAQALRDQAPAALSREPTVISMWLAVNDLNAGVDPAQYEATLDAIFDLLVPRTGARIFIGSVPDLRAVPFYARLDPQLVAGRVTAFNAAIARSAGRHAGRVTVVDLFTGSAELVSTATVSADGLHPSDRGYQLIAERFLTAMRAAGVGLVD